MPDPPNTFTTAAPPALFARSIARPRPLDCRRRLLCPCSQGVPPNPPSRWDCLPAPHMLAHHVLVARLLTTRVSSSSPTCDQL